MLRWGPQGPEVKTWRKKEGGRDEGKGTSNLRKFHLAQLSSKENCCKQNILQNKTYITLHYITLHYSSKRGDRI